MTPDPKHSDDPLAGQRVDERGSRPLEEATRSTEKFAADDGTDRREANVGLPGLGARPAAPDAPGRTHAGDQLYAEAKRKGIEGKSKMNKAELEKAVGR